MKSRILVALVGIPIVLAIILLTDEWEGGLPFTLLVGAVFTIAVLELYRMLRPNAPFVPAGMTAVALTPILTWAAGEPGMIAAMLVVLPLTMIFAQLSVERRDPAAALMSTLAPVLYVAPPAGLAVVLYNSSARGPYFVLLLLVAIWVND